MAWQCPACKDYVENGRIACTSCGTTRGGATSIPRPEAAGDPRRDLAMEGHLRATAFWYRAFGLLGLGLLVLRLLGGEGASEVGWQVVLGTILFGAVCVGAIILGTGLARLSSGARVIAGVLTLLSAAGTVVEIVRGHGSGIVGSAISLAWSGAYLWLYFSRRSRAVTTDSYRLIVRATPRQKPRTLASPFFWLPLVGVALMIVLVIVLFGVAAGFGG